MNYTCLDETCRQNGIPCGQNKPLAPLTTMKIGGECDRLVTAAAAAISRISFSAGGAICWSAQRATAGA